MARPAQRAHLSWEHRCAPSLRSTPPFPARAFACIERAPPRRRARAALPPAPRSPPPAARLVAAAPIELNPQRRCITVLTGAVRPPFFALCRAPPPPPRGRALPTAAPRRCDERRARPLIGPARACGCAPAGGAVERTRCPECYAPTARETSHLPLRAGLHASLLVPQVQRPRKHPSPLGSKAMAAPDLYSPGRSLRPCNSRSR